MYAENLDALNQALMAKYGANLDEGGSRVSGREREDSRARDAGVTGMLVPQCARAFGRSVKKCRRVRACQ